MQSYDSNDLRRSAFFRTVSGYMQFKGSYASNATVFFSGLATDEMYLNRAEGKAWEGDLDRGDVRSEYTAEVQVEKYSSFSCLLQRLIKWERFGQDQDREEKGAVDEGDQVFGYQTPEQGRSGYHAQKAG
jgi:hypothetical protein